MNLSDKIQEAKRRLPLLGLLSHYSLGHLAKGNHPSPFRGGDNKHCFNLFQAGEHWKWMDHARNEHGDEIDFIAKMDGLSPQDATAKFLNLAGVAEPAPPKPWKQAFNTPTAQLGQAFNWQACVDALEGGSDEIASLRGYSAEFVEALRANGLIGLYAGQVVASAQGLKASEQDR